MKRAPALLFFCLVALGGAGSASAADSPSIATFGAESSATKSWEDVGPNRLLLATGAASFAFAYGGSAWVGATSPRSEDRALLVPFAGPWLALGARGPCGEGGASCGPDTTYTALMVADGLVQAASAVQIALAFLHRDRRVTYEPAVRTASVTIAPSRPAGGGLALAAIGQF